MEPDLSLWHRGQKNGLVTTEYQNPWFKIINRDNYFSLEYGVPQVAILPLVEDDVLMIRVRRPLIDDEPWELPAGGSNPGEAPAEAARREFHEETGIYISSVSRFEPMGILSELPNRSPELLLTFKVHITLEEYNSRALCENEITDIKLMDIKTIKQAIASGQMYLSSPIAIISRYLFDMELNDN